VKWKEVAPLPVGRTVHTAVLLQGSIYVGGGFEKSYFKNDKHCYRLDIYNVHANRWDPSPITTPHCWFGMTVLDDQLIIAGGETKTGEITNKVLVLDEGAWKNYSEIPSARSDPAAVAHQSMLIIVGGAIKDKGNWTTLATTELLDTTNGCWYTCDDLPKPIRQLRSTILYNNLYLLGGKGAVRSSQVFTASLDNLSSHQLKWQSLPDTPWCFSAPVVLHNKFLLTVGGRQPSAAPIGPKTTEVCAFSPSSGLWKQITNIPAARSFPAVVSMANNKMIVLGGTSVKLEYCCDTWIGVFE